MFRTAVYALFFAMLAPTLPAGEDAPTPPPKPWRPFPELQDVLFFEDFENPESVAERGKIVADAPAPPGGHSFELANGDANEKRAEMTLQLLKTPLKMPGGVPPAQIWVQFNVWTDETGDMQVNFHHSGGEYSDSQRSLKEKTWVPVILHFSELRNKNVRPEAEQVCDKMDLYFRPRERKKFPKVYIDDIVFTTNGVKPADIFPRIAGARKLVIEVTRNVTRDGFSYSPHSQDLLRAALKSAGPRKKPRSSVIIGAKTDAEEWVKHLNAAAAKLKASGFSFSSASATDGAAGGLDDMRILLPSNLAKENAEYAIIALSFADATKPGRPSESVRVVMERTLAMGSVPIVILAPLSPTMTKEDRAKVEGFNNAVLGSCITMGITMIDPNVATKAAATAYEKNELNAAGIDAVATVAAQTVKHIDANLFTKK